jgi:hypothetical protein
MSHRSRFLLRARRELLGALVVAAAFASQAPAQPARDSGAAGSPGRAASGSCIYGADGRLIFSPRGGTCSQFAAPPAAIAPPSDAVLHAPPAPQRAAPAASPRAPAPQSQRSELAALLSERERLDVELARIREASAYEDREAARRVIEESLGKLARHLEREARVLQPLAAGAP